QHQREGPHEEQKPDAVPRDRLHLRGAAAPEAENQRAQKIGEDVDLEQPDEAARYDVERANSLAEEKASENPGAKCPENAREQPVALSVGSHNSISRGRTTSGPVNSFYPAPEPRAGKHHVWHRDR